MEPLRGREGEVVALFRSTFALGDELVFVPALFDRYIQVALGWYLENPDDSVVVVADGEVVGYGLLCVDHAALDRWMRGRMMRFVVAVMCRAATGRLDRNSRRFYWLRLRDTLTIVRSRTGVREPTEAEVHLNVSSGHRSGWASLLLLDALDSRCRAAGLVSWVGEINASPGTRIKPLRRIVGEIITVAPNRTFTWMMGEAITRLTVRRRLSER